MNYYTPYAEEVLTNAVDAMSNLCSDLESLNITDDTYYALIGLIEDACDDFQDVDTIDWYDIDEVEHALYIAEDIERWCKDFFDIYDYLIAEI